MPCRTKIRQGLLHFLKAGLGVGETFVERFFPFGGL